MRDIDRNINSQLFTNKIYSKKYRKEITLKAGITVLNDIDNVVHLEAGNYTMVLTINEAMTVPIGCIIRTGNLTIGGTDIPARFQGLGGGSVAISVPYDIERFAIVLNTTANDTDKKIICELWG